MMFTNKSWEFFLRNEQNPDAAKAGILRVKIKIIIQDYLI